MGLFNEAELIIPPKKQMIPTGEDRWPPGGDSKANREAAGPAKQDS